MRHAIAALVSMVLVVALTIGGFFAIQPAPVQAQATLVDCQLVVGQQTRVVCTLAGETVLNTVVDVPTVTLPPLPQATVTVPGATVTLPPATVTAPAPPRATETVRVNVPVPGPTSTVTVNVPTDGSTATVTLPPQPGKTVTETVRPNGSPVPTVTETATATETVEVEPTTGQTPDESGTIDRNSEDSGFFSPEIDLGDRTITAGETGLGLLGLLLIFALVVGGMFYGFRRGQLTRETNESDFLRAMLDRSKTE